MPIPSTEKVKAQQEELRQSVLEAQFELLKTAPSSTLEEMLKSGRRPNPSALQGKEFDGYNAGFLAQSPIGALLGIKKFRKRFYFDEATQSVKGCNVRMEQDSLDKPWTPMIKQGHFQVYQGYFDVLNDDQEYGNALLLDYTKSEQNGIFDGGMLKDYLVELGTGILLGKAYITIGKWKPMHSYFVLKQVE